MTTRGLFEDYIDDISSDINDQRDDVVSGKDKNDFPHSYVILTSFRTKDDVWKMIPHIRQLCNGIQRLFLSCPWISEFCGEVRTSDPYTEFGKFPIYANNELITKPIDSADPEEIFRKNFEYMENNRPKTSFLFDIIIYYDYSVEKLSYRQAFECMKMFAQARDFIYSMSKKFCSSNISHAMFIDGDRYNIDFERGNDLYNEKVFQHLVQPSGQEEKMMANEYIDNAVAAMRDRMNDNFSCPELLLQQFSSMKAIKFKPIYLAMASIQISVDNAGKRLSAYIPKNAKVDFSLLQYIAYVFFEWNKKFNRNSYSVEIDVLGTVTVYKDLGFLKWHSGMVTHIHKLVSINTPFKLIDVYLLHTTIVDEIEIVTPAFNTVGGDVQKYHTGMFMWKDKNVRFTSKDYDITFETNKKNQTYIVATKK
jgi:hypothetical protein